MWRERADLRDKEAVCLESSEREVLVIRCEM